MVIDILLDSVERYIMKGSMSISLMIEMVFRCFVKFGLCVGCLIGWFVSVWLGVLVC